MHVHGLTCMITGASSGLGKHFASVLATTGGAAHIVLAARRTDKLQEVAQVTHACARV